MGVRKFGRVVYASVFLSVRLWSQTKKVQADLDGAGLQVQTGQQCHAEHAEESLLLCLVSEV